MKLRNKSHILNFAFASFIGFVSGCSNSDNGGPVSDDAQTITVTGSVFAAPVKNANVVVIDTNGNVIAGPVKTGNDGSYQIELPKEAINGDLVFESSAGTFTDEASGDNDVAAGIMAAHIASGSLSSGPQVHMTPATTIAHLLVYQYSFSIIDAEAVFNGAFGYAPDHAVGPTSTISPAANAEDAQKVAGLRAAAFSQLAMELGLNSAGQFGLLAALADDLSDGGLDGKNASGAVSVGSTMSVLPEDIQNKFSTAMVNFRNSGNDNTGLTNDQIGKLPFAKVALTDSYRIEYEPGMMAAMTGKTTFKLQVTDRNTNAPASGLDVSLMPVMNMAMHNHGTPVGNVFDNGNGTYTATIYYLMASSMMNGMSMGYWRLNVLLDGMSGESTAFFPGVKMHMGGDTVQARLIGQDDKIAGMHMGDMPMPEARTYYVFSDGVSGATDNHTIDLFIAAKQSMMSYPALKTGMTLNAGDANYQLNVSSVIVEISTDASVWVMATETGNGQWTASSISGLADGDEGMFYLRLTVNGEQKTTDGKAAAGDGSNDYAMFTVTPAAPMNSM